MAGTHTLSGDILTLIGGDDFERLRAYVSMDQPRLVDPDDTTQNRVGDIDVILPTDTSTAITVELPDETWLPAPHWFRLHVEYRSRTAGVNKVWVSNEFEMTADRTIGSIPTDMPRAISEADYESLLTARDEAVAAAESVTLPTDGIIAGRINDPASATASALTAATEAVVDTKVPAASTTAQGKVELATNAEATTGTDTARAVTPAGVKAVSDAYDTANRGAYGSVGARIAAETANAGFAAIPAYNVTLATRAKWRKAVGRVIAGSGFAKMLFVGDSTDWGLGSGGADGFPPSKSVANLLNRSYLPTQYSFGVPPGGAAPTTDGDRDDRWSKNTVDGWVDASGWGAGNTGGFAHTGTSTSTAKTFTPGIACDTFDIYYLRNSGLGSLDISVDGGAVTTQSCAGALGVQKVTVTSSLASNHVLSIVKKTQTCFLLGVEAYDSTNKSIRVLNSGVCNSRAKAAADHWSAAGAGQALDYIGVIAPDLTVIRLGINDARLAASTSGADWETAIRAIIAKAQLTGDVILCSVVPSQATVLQNAGAGPGTAVALEQDYRDRCLTIATSLGCAYVDIFTRYGSFTAADAAGYMADGLHLNAVGSADAADAMRRVIVG